MSKKIFILMFLGMATVWAWGIDPVRFEVVERFAEGSGDWEFRDYGVPGGGSEPTSPKGFVAIGDRFYVEDYQNGRLVEFSLDKEWTVVSGRSGMEILQNSGNLMLALSTESAFALYDVEDNSRLIGGTFRNDLGRERLHARYVVLAGDVILYQEQNSGQGARYRSWYIPEDLSHGLEYRNSDQTISFLKDEYEGTEQFSVDENGYIFWNGRLIAPNTGSFSQYHWNTVRPTSEWQATVLFSRFVGWDRDGNTYWSDHRTISVLNPQGETLAFFEASNVADTSRSQFTVTPEGTLYCLSYNADRDEFELMKLERFW